jgi:hypothetical protein
VTRLALKRTSGIAWMPHFALGSAADDRFETAPAEHCRGSSTEGFAGAGGEP